MKETGAVYLVMWPFRCSSSWGFVVVSRCSVGCGVVDWILGVVLQSNAVGRNSCCVVSLG